MGDFNSSFDVTMGHEGGYANNPRDTGGETIFGITRRDHPTSTIWIKVDKYKTAYGLAKAIPLMNADAEIKSLAKAIYKTSYWDVNKLDQIKDNAIAAEIFDTGVNMGVGTAAKILQEGLNLTNNAGKLYPNIVVDGAIGPKTLELVNKHTRLKLLLNTINLLQGERYLNIMRKNESQEEFWASWCSRVLVTR